MKSLRQYILEAELGNIRKNIQFDIRLRTSRHADDRKTRHGSDARDRIWDEEIYNLVRKASDKIIDGLVYGDIEINETDSGRFCIRDRYTELNVIAAVHGYKDEDTLIINVITVYRGSDFRHNPKRTYTIDI